MSKHRLYKKKIPSSTQEKSIKFQVLREEQGRIELEMKTSEKMDFNHFLKSFKRNNYNGLAR
jgi:hypothetical protein